MFQRNRSIRPLSPKFRSPLKTNKEMPWKTNHKILSMFKKIDDMEYKSSRLLRIN